MRNSHLSRRELLGHTVCLAAIGSAPILLNACTKPEFHCEDLTGLSEADMELRSALEYRDVSPHGEEKSCSSCAFYKARKENECGQCTLVKGPIHPGGYCNSWAAKG
ncbi:MAG: high-potential iron-sulfur protein [Polyangiales bacterium]